MKNPAYKILLLGSLALFLNSCDSSKTDSKDKTTDKTSQKEDEMIIGVGTSDDPNATTPDEDLSTPTDDENPEDPTELTGQARVEADNDRIFYEVEEEKQNGAIEEEVVNDPRSEKEISESFIDKTPSKEEVFKGYVFKAHLNDYFDKDALHKISTYKNNNLKLLASPKALLNTERYKLCIFSRTNNFTLSKNLLKLANGSNCSDDLYDYKPPALNLPNTKDNTMLTVEVKPLDVIMLSLTAENRRLKLNQKTPFMKKVWKGITTPYASYSIPITLEPANKSDKNKRPSVADLMAMAQKFISKYLDQKWGDKALMPDKKLQNIYKKMFIFDPTKNFYNYDKNNKLVKTDKPWVYPYKNNKYGTLSISNWYPESNAILDIYVDDPKKSSIINLYSCVKDFLYLFAGYYDNKLYINFTFPLVNSDNIFFKYMQSSKPLEEGGVLPREEFNKVHEYLKDSCYKFG